MKDNVHIEEVFIFKDWCFEPLYKCGGTICVFKYKCLPMKMKTTIYPEKLQTHFPPQPNANKSI